MSTKQGTYTAEVNSCTLREGVSASTNRAYKFYQLNLTVTTPDGNKVSGEMTVDKEVKPGVYSLGVVVQTWKGRVSPAFGDFQPLTR